MADPTVVKVSALPELPALASDDLIEVVDMSETVVANKTKKMPASKLKVFNADQIGDGIVTSSKLSAGAATEAKIGPAAVSTTKIKDANVTLVKLAPNSVDGSKIVDLSVGTAELGDLAVTEPKLGADAVVTAKIKNANVTLLKLSTDIRKLLTKGIAKVSTTTVTLPHDVEVVIPFSTEEIDTSNFFNPANNTVLTIPAGLSGWYRVTNWVHFSFTYLSGLRITALRLNSAYLDQSRTQFLEGATSFSSSQIYHFNAGDQLSATAKQTTITYIPNVWATLSIELLQLD